MGFLDRLLGPPSPPQPADALLGAATALRVGRDRIMPQRESWQEEAWGFYDELGEFRFAVDWMAQMVSRCRLLVAEAQPGGDEPAPLDSGPPVDLLAELAGGVDGQAQMLATLETFLRVVGEGWIIGETTPDGPVWQVRSADEIRSKGGKVEVIREDYDGGSRSMWRTIADDSMVVRTWRPHKRFRHLADSSTRSARGIMREMTLVNSAIQAGYLSRLASSGLLVMPNEITFPVREEFADEPAPLQAELIETSQIAIQNPGSAASRIPIILQVPGEYVDKINLIDFTLTQDEKILEKRESAIKRLAASLDMPAEILTGLGDINHWGQWFTEESAVKTHVSSDVELICHCLTVGYLRPMLEAAGQDPSDLMVWYDPSELTVRPDRSEDAIALYDRLEIDGAALRRETGFSEDDTPSDEERKAMALLALLKTTEAGRAAEELGILEPAPEPVLVPGQAPEQPADKPRAANGPPDARDKPPASNGKAPARAASAAGAATGGNL